MKFKFKEWIKGNSSKENKVLEHIDSEFGKLIEKLDSLKVDRESVFIYGMFNLLEYLHIKNDNLFNRLRVLLEAYTVFIRMRTKYKKFPLPPTRIIINELCDEKNITFLTAIDYKSDGSSECYNLITALSKCIEDIINQKIDYRENRGFLETKH